MPKRIYQTPEIMHDAPLSNKKIADFHFDDFAATLARLIASPETETPLAIGVNGAWGSGKTSLLLRIKNMLDEPKGDDKKSPHRFAEGEERSFRRCKTVWFDAWKYGGEDQILAALLRVIVAEMQCDGFWSWLKSQSQVQKEELRWFDLLADSLLQFASAGVYSLNLGDYRVETPIKQASAFFDYFDDSLTKLLAAWVGWKSGLDGHNGALVIFIDDLDRCLPDKTVQVLEAVKLFLDKHGCVFVLGADTKIVQAAVETYYKNTGITDQNTKDYLEKIIQIRFDIPPIIEKAMENYLKAQAKSKVDEAMLTHWQALVAAAEVNPRRVKNVINDLNLQWFMAVNSGQGEGVNRDDFICWQALMRAAPRTFVDHILGTLEDSERRHSFIMDALKWQQGEQEERERVQGYFSAYEDKDSKRLRGVLKQISFSDEFTPDTLESMIYMSAPPAKAEVMKPGDESPGMPSISVAEPEALAVGGEVSVEGKLEPLFLRREIGVVPGDLNHITIGGLDFVRVLAGKFVMGSKDDSELALDSEKPQHTVDLPYDYWMAKFILTNRQFAEFAEVANYVTIAEKEGGWIFGKGEFARGIDWKHPTSPDDTWESKTEHPVVQISWDDASAYCKWFNETYQSELEESGGLTLRLPTEAEWEKAARGAYGNEWPWGNEFDKTKCNSIESGKDGTTPVGAYSALGGDSPYGCADMVGNVWEWTHSLFQKYPYEADDGREDARSRYARVLRGGSFSDHRRNARGAFRVNYGPDFRNFYLGFRVCVTPYHTAGI